MALNCTCNPNQIQTDRVDIHIANISIAQYGKETGRQLKRQLEDLNMDHKLGWSPIHHLKVLWSSSDPKCSTRVAFLRYCDTNVHEDVIRKLNGQEWPDDSGLFIRVEFNKFVTQTHHIRSNSRTLKLDASTQTTPNDVEFIRSRYRRDPIHLSVINCRRM